MVRRSVSGRRPSAGSSAHRQRVLVLLAGMAAGGALLAWALEGFW